MNRIILRRRSLLLCFVAMVSLLSCTEDSIGLFEPSITLTGLTNGQTISGRHEVDYIVDDGLGQFALLTVNLNNTPMSIKTASTGTVTLNTSLVPNGPATVFFEVSIIGAENFVREVSVTVAN